MEPLSLASHRQYWLEVTFTCRDPAVQPFATTFLQLAGTCCSHCFTSKQADTHSACSPLSLEMKREHVESDYTPGTLLCPPQSDDGDDRAWIFTALDVNILACQQCTSPVPTPVHLHGSVKRWSCLYFTTLPCLFPLSPFISYLNYWKNKLLPAGESVKMINGGACFCVLLMALQPLCIQSSFLFSQVWGEAASWAAARALLGEDILARLYFNLLVIKSMLHWHIFWDSMTANFCITLATVLTYWQHQTPRRHANHMLYFCRAVLP